MNLVQFQCPRLRQWPGHSSKWGSQQLSGLPHPQSNLCSGSVLPQHLLFTRHISPSHCPPRDCSHLTGLSTSLLPHHSPSSLQPAIKSDCLFISHPALYAGNFWTHCSKDKTQTSHLAHKTLHCSLAPSSPSLTVPSACIPLHLSPASPASCSYSSPGALLGSPQLTHCISGTPALMVPSLSFIALSMVGILITPATWEYKGENRTASDPVLLLIIKSLAPGHRTLHSNISE